MISVPAAKDVSELYLRDPENFPANLERAMGRAVPFAELEARRQDQRPVESWAVCAELAHEPRILDRFLETLVRLGHVGEQLGRLRALPRHRQPPPGAAGVGGAEGRLGRGQVVHRRAGAARSSRPRRTTR